MYPILLFAAGLLLISSDMSQKKAVQPPEVPPPNDHEPDASRVKIFEGRTLDDFRRDIPDRRGKDVFLRSIAETMNYSGNPLHVDAGVETIRVSALFRKNPQFTTFSTKTSEDDEKKYEVNYNRIEWSSRRGDIKEEFHLSKVDHPGFQAWFDSLPPWASADFKSLPAFDQEAEQLSEKLPQLEKTHELNVLYPASGSSVSPLITAMRLIESGKINRANFVYTEINDRDWDHLRNLFEEGLKNHVFDQITELAPVVFPNEGEERTMELSYQGHPIKLTFALKRSGESYFRPEYLKNADLVIIHDPQSPPYPMYAFDHLGDVLFQKRQQGFWSKDQMVIMEGAPHSRFAEFYGRSTFPVNLSQSYLEGPYGHCDGYDGVGEIKECSYLSARTFLLNDPSLEEIVSSAKSPLAISRSLYSLSESERGVLEGPQVCEANSP